MRNITTVLFAVLIVAGCLNEKDSNTSASNPDDGQSGNTAPSITGNPPSAVTMGDLYNFLPTAVGFSGDTLSFTIENLPVWAIFDAKSGRIFGRPSLGDVGVYDDISISVSDGKNSDSLPAYSLVVSQSGLGAVTLSWVAPTENVDGSALTDLGGYTIHYGKNPGVYDKKVQINDPSVSTVVVEQLLPDTYYFAATAFNQSGIESLYSGEIERTVE